ncbi:MAG: hypothetical protein P1P87_10475 [Trueperaceae bacterium]|nr:hypothetical protein [Trueperaceae bacterium]
MRTGLALGAMLVLMMTSTGQSEGLVSARYEASVDRYGHFALGRPHEYARVLARTDAGRTVALELPEDEVFEDLAPRLVRLTEDGPTLLLTIVSARGTGARLALIGLQGDVLEVVAQSAPIGTPHRWLNPVGVADLDGDGVAEIAAVTTPHIGGVLRVYRRDGEHLVERASLTGFSNHVYRSAELDLSRPATIGGRTRLLVPDVARTSVRVIALDGDRLVETDRCALDAPVTGPDALRACEDQPTGAP